MVRDFPCCAGAHCGERRLRRSRKLALGQLALVSVFAEFALVLFLPLRARDAVFFLHGVAVLLRQNVEGAERNDSSVGHRVVNAASFDAFDVVIVQIHEMHHADEKRVVVEFAQSSILAVPPEHLSMLSIILGILL